MLVMFGFVQYFVGFMYPVVTSGIAKRDDAFSLHFSAITGLSRELVANKRKQGTDLWRLWAKIRRFERFWGYER